MTTDVRVLHVINSLGTGGAERSLAELAPGLRAHGISPTIAILEERPSGVEPLVRAAGVPVVRIAATGWIGRIREIRALIRNLQPDVVHTTIFDADVSTRLAAVGTGIPVVTSVVNPSYGAARGSDPGVRSAKLRAVRVLDGFTARHLGRGFHAISEAMRPAAVQSLGVRPDRVVVIPRGRSTERLGTASPQRRRAERAALGVADDRLLVVNAARREYQKGQQTLVDAAVLLCLDDASNPLVLVAGRDGSESASLTTSVERQGLADDVRFLGHVEQVPDLLAAADVFAFPSRFEGLGGAVLEAFALEVPVVASDVPALREVLEDGRLGLLVPVDDAAALADAIRSVRNDPSSARARAALAHSAFDERYRLDRVVAQMAAWLRSFASTKGPQPPPPGRSSTGTETRSPA